jgi:hypothetical protein
MQTGPGAKPAPAKWRNTAAARQIRQQPKDRRQPRHAARRRSRPSRPKPRCSTRSGRDRPVHGPPSSCSHGRNETAVPTFADHACAGPLLASSTYRAVLLKMAAGFNPGRFTMFLGLLMSASPILMLTCKDGLSTTTAKPKPPAPSMLTKHKAPEAGLWPAREQLPDVPAIPALAPRRNYLRLKPIMGHARNAIWISKLAEKILPGPEQHDALGPKLH